MSIKAIILSSVILVHSWYPPACCSGQDCKPVDCLELIEQNNGSVKYKDFIFSKDKIKPSQDMQCHVCVGESKDVSGKTNYYPRCVFVHFNT